MFVRTKQPLDPGEVIKLAHRLWEAMGGECLYIPPGGEAGQNQPYARHCLEIIEEYTQEGPSLFPEPGEQFIQVHFNCRYYGPGYEGGPILQIAGIAQWLKANIEECQIWYGGQYGGAGAGPLDIAGLLAHWYRFGHTPYRHYLGKDDQAPWCPRCQLPTLRVGWGQDYAAYKCGGCSYAQVTKDGTTHEGDNLEEE